MILAYDYIELLYNKVSFWKTSMIVNIVSVENLKTLSIYISLVIYSKTCEKSFQN